MVLPSFTKNEKLILASVVVVLILFWVVVGGYIWVKTGEIVDFESIPIDTKTYQIPTSSPTDSFPQALTPTPYSHGKNWRKYQSDKHKLSFNYPEQIGINSMLSMSIKDRSTIEREPTTYDELLRWELQNSQKDSLISISIADSTLERIRELYPELNFADYTTENFSGKKAIHYTNNIPDYALYILNRDDGTPIQILGLFTNFDTTIEEAEKITDQLVRTIQTS